MRRLFVFAFMLLVLAAVSNAAEIPVINSYVTDNAGVLSQDAKSQLETALRDLEKSTNGVQYVIYIEKEYLKEYSLEEYTLKIAEQNKIGKKGNDNGVLFYIAVNDKKYRWEVGYGVESTLNSALLGRISRERIVPNFQQGNYEKGVLEAFDITKRLLLNSNDADIIALKSSSNQQNEKPGIIFSIIFFIMLITPIIIFVIFVTMAIKIFKKIKDAEKVKGKKHNDGFYHGAAWGLFSGGFGRGGFGGGRFGGSGFGGFSGGGGRFGGGGHSGGW